jgi:hypothetical protein
MENQHEEQILGEASLFDPIMVQLGLVDELDQAFAPSAPIQKGMPIEFHVKSAAHQYMDLNNTKLKVKCKITKPDGGAIAKEEVSVANLTLHSLFQEAAVQLNRKSVGDPSNMYPYRAHIATLLNYEGNVMKKRLLSEGWILDDADDLDDVRVKASDALNEGLVSRSKWFEESKTVTLIGRPHIDVFHQPKLLPPNVDLSVKLIPATDPFVLIYQKKTGENAINPEYRLTIVEVTLIVRMKKLADSLELAHREMVIERNFRLPYTRIQSKTLAITTGIRTYSFENLFSGTLPDRVIIGLVEESAFAGNYHLNPFWYRNYNVTRMDLKRNGVPVPRLGYRPNFQENDYMQDYLTFQEECGYGFADKCVPLTPAEWAEGYTLFVFKVTDGPVGTGDATPRSRSHEGNLKIEIDFGSATPHNIKAIILSEAPGLIEIDQFNNVIVL